MRANYHERSILSNFSIILAITLCAGCGGSDGGPVLVPVKGVATVDGVPIAGLGISFRGETVAGKPEYFPGGSTDAKGMYSLITAGKDGAPIGTYKVVVFPPSSAPGAEAPKVAPPSFNKKYLTPETTDITLKVAPGVAAGTYDLKLTK